MSESETSGLFKGTDPNTWLQHFIADLSPIPRYQEILSQLKIAEKTVTQVQQTPLSPPPTSTSFLTPLRKEALQSGLADHNAVKRNTPLTSSQTGGVELLLLSRIHEDAIKDAQDDISICHSAFAQLCVPNEQLGRIRGGEDKAKAPAVDPAETMYYSSFQAIEDMRGLLKFRQAMSEKPWAMSVEDLRAADNWELSHLFIICLALDVGILKAADELKYEGDREQWEKSMGDALQKTYAAETVATQLVDVLARMAKVDGVDVEATWWYKETVMLDFVKHVCNERYCDILF